MISIVIVNFNGGELLIRCLKSIKEQTYKDYEVIIVDNNSLDNSMDLVEQILPAKKIFNPVNVGFAKAQNQGIRSSKGQYIMTMNFDLQLKPDFFSQVISSLESNEHIGTVTGKMLRMKHDGSLTRQIDNTGVLLSKRRVPILRGQNELDKGQFQVEDYVFGAMGAAAVHKKIMLEDIKFKGQYFDENFFMWYEDIDLDWRSRIYGWDCLYVPQAVAYHIGDPHDHRKKRYATKLGIRNRWSMIISNENLKFLITDAIWLIQEELAILLYVIRKKKLEDYILAIIDLLSALPDILRKRAHIQRAAIRGTPIDYPKSIT